MTQRLTDANDRLAEECGFEAGLRGKFRNTRHADPDKRRRRKIAKRSRKVNRAK